MTSVERRRFRSVRIHREVIIARMRTRFGLRRGLRAADRDSDASLALHLVTPASGGQRSSAR